MHIDESGFVLARPEIDEVVLSRPFQWGIGKDEEVVVAIAVELDAHLRGMVKTEFYGLPINATRLNALGGRPYRHFAEGDAPALYSDPDTAVSFLREIVGQHCYAHQSAGMSGCVCAVNATVSVFAALVDV